MSACSEAVLTRIATVTPATIHAVRITAAIAGVAVRLCVATSHVAIAAIVHPAIARIAHAIGRRTAL